MQQQSGGWLPTGFTELEYLECSGTQWVETGVSAMTLGSELGLFTRCEFLSNEENAESMFVLGTRLSWLVKDFCILGNYFGIVRWGNKQVLHVANKLPNKGRFIPLNITIDGGISTWSTDDGSSQTVTLTGDASFNSETIPLFACKQGAEVLPSSLVRIYALKLKKGVHPLLDVIPALDPAGTPCMYDKVSRQCFYNAGAGSFGYRVKTAEGGSSTYSLRDPYYTAPSGIYARLAGENELEILADTEEPQGEGWEWFANTGEAYTAYNITPAPDID